MSKLDQGRDLISRADLKIAAALSRLKPTTPTTHNHTCHQDRALKMAFRRMHESGAPSILLEEIIRFTDLSKTRASTRHQILRTITGALSERWRGVAHVAAHKLENGITNSYDPVRHHQVIRRAADVVGQRRGDREMVTAIYSAITGDCVEMQNEVLNHGTGPLAEYIKEFL